MEFVLWAVGIIITLLVTLHIRNINIRANSAHEIIESHRLENKDDKEKMYNRIKSGEDKTHNCRIEVDKEMNAIAQAVSKLMTQEDVKDFVDREFKPVHKSLESLDEKAIKSHALTSDLLSKVQVLLDRSNSE